MKTMLNDKRILVLWGVSIATLFIAPLFGLTFLNPFNSDTHFILWNMRIPRVIAAWLIGAILALSGMCFQAILKNPLAEPFTLGVASGSALGASIYIHLGFSFNLWFMSGVSLCAFIGAGLITLLIYLVSFRELHNTLKLLLMGVILSFFCSSLIMLLQAIGRESDTAEVIRWMMGRISLIDYQEIRQLAITAMIGTFVIVLFTPQLNLLNKGHITAMTRGVNPRFTISVLFITISLLLGVVVAISGPIGFVGLIVPHIARQIFGNDHRILWSVVMAMGGLVLVLADLFASIILRPSELPVGVVTSILGSPFFLWVLLRKKRKV